MSRTFFAIEGTVLRRIGGGPIFTSAREIESFLTAWEAPDASETAKSLASELRAAVREAEAQRHREAA